MHWRRKWQPTPVFLPGESQGWGAWWAAVYGVTQSWTRLKQLSSSSSSRANTFTWGFPGGSDGKESASNAGDPGSIPGSGRPPGEGNGYLLQCSCLGNPMDWGAWATVHGVAKSQTQLNIFIFLSLNRRGHWVLQKYRRTHHGVHIWVSAWKPGVNWSKANFKIHLKVNFFSLPNSYHLFLLISFPLLYHESWVR